MANKSIEKKNEKNKIKYREMKKKYFQRNNKKKNNKMKKKETADSRGILKTEKKI